MTREYVMGATMQDARQVARRLRIAPQRCITVHEAWSGLRGMGMNVTIHLTEQAQRVDNPQVEGELRRIKLLGADIHRLGPDEL